MCYNCRLQREALKQAAIDPSTGKIDITILTTGISSAGRKQRAQKAQVNLFKYAIIELNIVND